MSWFERADAKRLMVIATWLEANVAIPAPSIIGAHYVAWHITGRPAQEALVMAITSNWKVVRRDGDVATLTGFHASLGQVNLHVDRWGVGAVERDFAALGIAVPSEAAS